MKIFRKDNPAFIARLLHEGSPFYIETVSDGIHMKSLIEGWSYSDEVALILHGKQIEEQEKKIEAQKAVQAERKKAWLEKKV